MCQALENVSDVTMNRSGGIHGQLKMSIRGTSAQYLHANHPALADWYSFYTLVSSAAELPVSSRQALSSQSCKLSDTLQDDWAYTPLYITVITRQVPLLHGRKCNRVSLSMQLCKGGSPASLIGWEIGVKKAPRLKKVSQARIALVIHFVYVSTAP